MFNHSSQFWHCYWYHQLFSRSTLWYILYFFTIYLSTYGVESCTWWDPDLLFLHSKELLYSQATYATTSTTLITLFTLQRQYWSHVPLMTEVQYQLTVNIHFSSSYIKLLILWFNDYFSLLASLDGGDRAHSLSVIFFTLRSFKRLFVVGLRYRCIPCH